MSLYRDQGIVLRTYKLGEADRIVVFVTKGHGKVRAVAKGVRKTKSKFGARLEPTSHVAVQLYEGRELDIVTQAETLDHFKAIRGDLERIGAAAAMLEAVDHLSQEGEINPQLYRMLLGALRTLAGHNAPLVTPSFFLKLLALEGFGMIVDECMACGATTGLEAVDVDAGGTLCREHRQGVAVSAEGLGLLRQILGGQLGAALNEPESPATHEVQALATNALEHHLERRLRSVTLLDRG
ncbi:MAG: DNA repair protein RecO [Acidimicrobiales bacterium]|nr:MAG: DNA repair protein RecO [Actinomycetota bacterium]MBV6507539.1 DNA repair protein RecO [Acidimicrobiales bacterium]RIK07481.1 MAG: DNA repair protein RecO [Acidobacteriota bacterium]